MTYSIIFAPEAKVDIQKLNKSSEKGILIKIDLLLNERKEHPTTGTGKPKLLTGNFSGLWSRRISDKHRLVYRIEDQKVTIVVLHC
jgi:toxin YoeB